ncbi:MAG: N-acetyltransferase [Chloroflexota bacterium]|nr:N-acetyltransferase [Chloroflexota bacterium]
MKVEKAKIADAPQMHRIINKFAADGGMLARALSEIYENIRDYFVVREADKVIACIALHVSWSDLAEIKSLAVIEDNQKQGIGTSLVSRCIEEARELGIDTLFCLTYKPIFFQNCGFTLIERSELPRKVWGECYRCPKFPDCDETALIMHLGPPHRLSDEYDPGADSTN